MLAFFLHDWLLHPLNGQGYQWWSGIGSDIGEVTILGGVVMVLRHVNCNSPRCLRVGRHPTADGQHHLCRHHHPDHPSVKLRAWLPKWWPGNVPHLTLAEIHARHHAASHTLD